MFSSREGIQAATELCQHQHEHRLNIEKGCTLCGGALPKKLDDPSWRQMPCGHGFHVTCLQEHKQACADD